MSVKKMNGYRLQYWLYAVFNNQFGRDVKLERDPLHHMYSVNRHGFSAHGHNTTALYMFEVMVKRMQDCGFTHDVARGHAIEPGSKAQLVKHRQVGKQIETIYLTFAVARSMVPSDKPFVTVWSAVYYSKAK